LPIKHDPDKGTSAGGPPLGPGGKFDRRAPRVVTAAAAVVE